MLHGGLDLPSGYRLTFHESIDSTNAEALRLAGAGEDGGLWIWAAVQEAGRGRAGRSWASPAGNLHASLLLRPRVPLATALQLSLLAGVAAHDAVSALAAGAGVTPTLRLKWPNDILLDDAKLGGILLESRSGAEADAPAVVIGIGLNLARAPDDLGRPVASLAAAGIEAEPVAGACGAHLGDGGMGCALAWRIGLRHYTRAPGWNGQSRLAARSRCGLAPIWSAARFSALTTWARCGSQPKAESGASRQATYRSAPRLKDWNEEREARTMSWSSCPWAGSARSA